MATVEEGYDVASDFDEARYGDIDMESTFTRSSRLRSGDDAESYLQASEKAMQQLQALEQVDESEWKRVLKHKSGVVVNILKKPSLVGMSGNIAGKSVPVIRGQHFIPGHQPADVFSVVGIRRVWDDWYSDGYLVENLSETTSLTYMSMEPMMGISTRDLSLVERVAGSSNGTILFVAASVISPLIPRVSGRVRAKLGINGWLLKPKDGGTVVTYYLQANVGTMLPKFAALRYLVTRPVQLAKIEEYLNEDRAGDKTGNGAVANGSGARTAGAAAAGAAGAGAVGAGVGAGVASADSGSLLKHVSLNQDVPYASVLAKAHEKLVQTANESKSWKTSVLSDGSRFHSKDNGSSLPLTQTTVNISDTSVDQVIGMVLSAGARSHWDVLLHRQHTEAIANGIDQGLVTLELRGMFPRLPRFHDVVAFSVQRNNTGATVAFTHVDDKAPNSFKSPRGRIGLLGFVIAQDPSDNGVDVTYITEVDPPSSVTVSHSTKNAWSAMAARGVVDIHEFIDAYGAAPFFTRWSDPAVSLVKSAQSVKPITEGGATFYIEKTGSVGEGARAWLQWSDRMYDRGLSLSIEPADAAKVALVNGAPSRVLQFDWSSSLDKARVVLSRANADGPDDVYLGDRYVDETVTVSSQAADKGTGPGRSGPETGAATGAGVGAAAGAGAGALAGAAGAGAAGAGLAKSNGPTSAPAPKKAPSPKTASPAPQAAAAPSPPKQEVATTSSPPGSITVTYNQIIGFLAIFAIAFVLGKFT